ncbi:uncharacterized protein LOC135716294 [Ochlerotatus camptorhynchus]|uniref:uncharacterized protein LOC135716294 n=1 Tax=Ochlerotatus camptorhynchus TaxID=644619 RepID=UPI0031CEB2E3
MDRRAKELLKTTTVRVEGGYETGLLWKKDDFQFPDSKRMAIKRLDHLERRLKKNPVIEQNVRLQIEEYQRKGYAHKASLVELAKADPRKVWYLPLNYVLHPKKPNKVRLVWDAAAQVDGVSLNSMLLTGPDFLTSLTAVIQRFRERLVAFGADICEMFHQIWMREVDKHALRFLFRTDPSAKDPDVFLMDVMTFGAACSPASAQYIKNLNAAQFSERFPEAVKAIIRRHYVDDYLDSADSVDEAIERAKQVRYIHSQAGFELHHWVSNSDACLADLGESEVEERIPLHDSKDSKTARVLGIIWCPKQDVFTFSTSLRDDLIPYLTTPKRPTKRIALSCIMCLFDPIGLLAPFTIQGKILMQDLWRAGCEWDQEMDDQSYAKWTHWRSLLPQIEKLKIPRCYLRGAPPETYSSLQLHVLVDAGEKAYGAVAFFRVTTPNGSRCSLVMAKTKVAPLKPLSIPRLELQAAVLGVRLLNTVVANHDVQITKRVLWTDSRTVLSWIRSDHRNYKPFVAFRIGEILQETVVDEWRWVPTRSNVADMLTKWGNGPVLDNNSAWFNGPDFLQLPEESWPTQKLPPSNTTEELRACHMFHNDQLSEPLIDVTRISRWNVVLRTVCVIFRFISNCRRRVQGRTAEPIEVSVKLQRISLRAPVKTVVPLKQEEYEKAELVLWRLAQRECFPHEITILSKNQAHPK